MYGSGLSKDEIEYHVSQFYNLTEQLGGRVITPNTRGVRSLNNHQHIERPRCGACHRFEPTFFSLNPEERERKYINLADDHSLCPDCYSTAVLDAEKCQLLVSKVREFYQALNLKISKKIPIFLTDMVEMRRVLTKNYDNQKFRGLTMFNIKQDVFMIKNCLWRKGKMKVNKELQKSYKISIFLPFGYPEIITGATLAHEMMHVWLRDKGCMHLANTIAEGICEVMAYKWLDYLSSNNSQQPPIVRNLIQHERSIIQSTGIGFRLAKTAVDKYGLKHTLKKVIETGNLPD